MGLDGCGQMCKCVLIIFNIVFAVLGLAMFGLGLWLRFSAGTRGFFDIDLNTAEFTIGITVLMVLGGLLLLVAVFGDCGTCNESSSFLSVYSCFLALLMVILVGTGVLGYMKSDYVSERLVNFYATVYAQYLNNRDEGLAMTLKIFHNSLGCCGVVGHLDVLLTDTCPKTGIWEAITTSKLQPCPPVISNLFKEKAPLMLCGFLGTAALLVTALVMTGFLLKEIKRGQRSMPVQYSRPVY